MTRIEYYYIDKKEWGKGPWKEEPDKVQYTDENTGYPCLIVRGPSGALCGYVGISKSHPYYARPYDEIAEIRESPSVHGELTYSEFCNEEDTQKGVCHIPMEGEEHKVWWLGFDCAHLGDYCPGDKYHCPSGLGNETYKSISFVKDQIESLARQLKSKEINAGPDNLSPTEITRF